jgi:hypothetical protein
MAYYIEDFKVLECFLLGYEDGPDGRIKHPKLQ